jgi:DNA repair protein RecO (recombination protein O)
MRVQLEPAYVLHRRPYRETSLLVETLARDHGRVAVVARGARGERSPLRGLLQPFRPLLISWSGRHDLMTLSGAEPAGVCALSGRGLLAGFYLNELLTRLLARHDPHSGLFETYEQALLGLGQPGAEEQTLRVFERRLLEVLGYGLALGETDTTGARIEPDRTYRYRLETGAVPAGDGEEGLPVRGATLLALASGQLADRELSREAKQLMRYVLQHYLGARPLESRALFTRPGPGVAGGSP